MGDETWAAWPADRRYEVSSMGRVRSWRHQRGDKYDLREPRMLCPQKNKRGYLQVCVGVTAKIHRMVLESFVGPGAGLQARHANGARTDNRLENLSWGTSKENSADRDRHGTTVRGEKSKSAKLTQAMVDEIRASGLTTRVLGVRYGVSSMTISQIKRRVKWK